jgi:hypothetical protein
LAFGEVEYMKKTNTIALIAMLVISFAITIAPAVAQSHADPAMGVAWVVEENNVTQFEHSEEQSNWIFGPQPQITILYANNMTDIGENSYRVNVGDDLLVDISVPRSFLKTDLDSIQFWGTGRGDRAAFFGLEYNLTADRWNCLAYRYVAGSDEPRSSNFITLDSLGSSYTEDANFYHVVFAITYESPIAPGVFSTGMQVVDTEGRPVASNWLVAAETGAYVSPPIGFGSPVIPTDFSLPNYYYADIVGEDGRIIHYVDVNDTFIVRMMSNVEIGSTLLPFAQLTWDPAYHIKRSLTYPVGMDVSESVLFNKDVAWKQIETDLYPVMFLKVNATDSYVLAGYIDVAWEWIDLGGGAGMWFPHILVTENSTIDLSKYFVVNHAYTSASDRHLIQWGGYFTNETDMDPSFGYGGTIQPEMSLVTVLDTNNKPITARPEIKTKGTMKLAFRSAFVEAFVFNGAGQIADVAQQGDLLNLTMLIHRNMNEINGSMVYEVPSGTVLPPALFNATQELQDVTIEVDGSYMDSNETNYWRVDITHAIGVNFTSGLPIGRSLYRLSMYEKGGSLLWSVPIPANHIHVSSYSINIQRDLTTLSIIFSFDPAAPSMVIDKAKVNVGLLTNVRIWDPNNATWSYPWWMVSGGQLTPAEYNQLVASWTNVSTKLDLSGDTLWSPRNLRLGDVNVYIPPIWTVTKDGAIDLDGNIYTTNDQYYVKRTGFWSDWGNVTVSGMFVALGFDPTPGNNGDEFVSENWMGVLQMDMWFNANETFYWYHTDGSLVGATEMGQIQKTLWADMDNEIPIPGYEYVAWTAKNRTLDVSKVPGLEGGKWSNTWFAWGTRQTYWVGISETQATLARFRAEYAGLLIFNDGIGPTPSAPDFSIVNGQVTTDEVTHLVLIDEIGSYEFRRPFGATNNSANVRVDPDTSVTFGVSIYDVNVTIYPLRVEHSSALRGAWDFRQSYEGSIGLNSTSFDYSVTRATVDEMSFDITFGVDMVTYDAEDPNTWNHAVSFKVDQRFGEWTLYGYDNSILENRSLAVNFFGVLGTATGSRYTAGDRPVTDTNSASLKASYYDFGSEDRPYASVTMGGLPYTYGGDGHSTVYTSGSSTAPIGAFSIMYESAAGSSVTNWQVDASMLFMTSGYEHWGGHEIICDPVFVAYTSSYQSSGPTTPYTPGEGNPLVLYLIVGGVVALVVIVCGLYRRR